MGTCVVYAVVFDCTRPLAAQGLILNGYPVVFSAEAVALETAVIFLVDWLHHAVV